MGVYEENKLIEDRKFIVDNINLLDSYDLKDALQRSKKVKFQNETAIHFNYVESKVNIRDEYNKMKADALEIVTKHFTIEEFTTVTKIHHAIDWYFFRAVKDTKDKFHYRNNYFNSLFEFLNFILNDVVSNDSKFGNEIHDKYSKEIDKGHTVIPELNNLSFKAFMNGNIQIKGLTPENLEKINFWTEKINLAKRLDLCSN